MERDGYYGNESDESSGGIVFRDEYWSQNNDFIKNLDDDDFCARAKTMGTREGSEECTLCSSSLGTLYIYIYIFMFYILYYILYI